MKAENIKNKIKGIYASAMLTITAMTVTGGAFALDTDSVTWNDSVTDVNTLLGTIIGLILGLAQGIGAVVMILGIFKAVSSLKDGNANEQSQGIQLALVGVFLISLKTLLKAAGLIS